MLCVTACCSARVATIRTALIIPACGCVMGITYACLATKKYASISFPRFKVSCHLGLARTKNLPYCLSNRYSKYYIYGIEKLSCRRSDEG